MVYAFIIDLFLRKCLFNVVQLIDVRIWWNNLVQVILGFFLRWFNITNFTYSLLQVFPYGSVPLKTYLPDGDIDLTALSCQNIEDGLVSDVHAVLRGEENNDAAEYEVKDVRFIDAEVLSTFFLDTLSVMEYSLIWETFFAKVN